MSIALHFHPEMIFLLPCLSHIELRCSDPKCGTSHGWIFEIGFLYWSVIIESLTANQEDAP
jgi:hypothetical protein